MNKINIFWLRRDLRLDDNHGLYAALRSGLPVLTVFIFDKNILKKLEDKNDARVSFIYNRLEKIHKELEIIGSSIKILYDDPLNAFKKLLNENDVNAVYANHDYEPYALIRDNSVQDLMENSSVEFITFKDQVIFEKDEILKNNGQPYQIYTPYSNKWLELLNEKKLINYDCSKYLNNFVKIPPHRFPLLNDIGFKETEVSFPPDTFKEDLIRNYDKYRNLPYLDSTSHLGVHLRFGTISIRKLVNNIRHLNFTFLKELIWREFFMMILWHFPQTVNEAFKKKYDNIIWRNNEKEFEIWCSGNTGYPIVDAGMRQLNKTGFMHNRVRMITASFLVKHLLIDWRLGEAYFAQKLLDYEQSSNVGNWQWVAGTGCDAAPYFRIFNPVTQLKKYDPQMKYCKKWIQELMTDKYPGAVIEHKYARERALNVYNNALKSL